MTLCNKKINTNLDIKLISVIVDKLDDYIPKNTFFYSKVLKKIFFKNKLFRNIEVEKDDLTIVTFNDEEYYYYEFDIVEYIKETFNYNLKISEGKLDNKPIFLVNGKTLIKFKCNSNQYNNKFNDDITIGNYRFIIKNNENFKLGYNYLLLFKGTYFEVLEKTSDPVEVSKLEKDDNLFSEGEANITPPNESVYEKSKALGLTTLDEVEFVTKLNETMINVDDVLFTYNLAKI